MCSLILSSVFGLKTVLEEGGIGVTVLKYSAVFMVKLLINIPNAVHFFCSKLHFVNCVSVCQ